MSRITKQMEELLTELNLPDMEATDNYGNTALHLAVKNKSSTQKKIVEVIEVLIGRGINPNSKNNKNQTALHLAVLNRMKDVINCLMAHKVDLDLVAHFFVEHEYLTFQEWFAQMDNLDEWYGEILRMETEGIDFAEWLISKGIDFDCKNQANQSALYMAVEHHLQHILPVLLKCTKDINFVEKETNTLLYLFLQDNFTSTESSTKSINKKWYANRYEAEIVQIAIAKEEDLGVTQLMIERSLNINGRDDYMYVDTLFQTVIRLYFLSTGPSESKFYLKILQAIISNGISVNELNKVDKFEYTALRSAVEDRKLQLIKLLAENGANFSFATIDGKNLLHLLVTSTYGKTELDAEEKVCDLLISKGCQVNAKDSNGNTPLHEAVVRENVAIVRKLIAHGADVNCKRNDGMTPLHVCVVKRLDKCILEFLEENGADFSVTTVDEKNLLHLIVQRRVDANDAKETALFDLLIRKNCQVNAKDIDGNTPLHKVVDVAIARKLIVHGAEVNCKNFEGLTALQVAVIKMRDFPLIELLLKNSDISVITEDGKNLLHLFARYTFSSDDDEIIARFCLLIDLISEGWINEMDKSGNTPLHLAANHNDAMVVWFFIDRGADVNCRNTRGKTPLHLAMENEDVLEITKLLLERGANVNAKDSQGHTALHKVALGCRSYDSSRAFIVLLQYGADVNARDRRGLSALFHARRRDFADSVEYIGLGSAFRASDVTKLLTQHSIKLMAVDLPWDREINRELGDSDETGETENPREKYEKECSEEVKILKTTFIDSCTSLYALLRMDLNRRRVHIYNEKLQKLVQSPGLPEHFPKYYTLILASYHEAVTRKSLLESAKEAWFELTKISLPEVCIERVFAFLSNTDLFDIIEKN